MNAHARQFQESSQVRGAVPLLVGLMGPSGGGKTYSALRLATGIQQVSGGDIWVIDTEAERARHYDDKFKFRHLSFGAPFGPLDYLAAINFVKSQNAGVVIVDSMSHEHEGPGGVLDMHDKELDRMAGQDYGKRNAMNLLAWAKPKAMRRELINGILQIKGNFIFCFRAKEKVKPIKRNGKSEVENQGWMPIAGEEFVFEQTVNCLLMPGSRGVPTWQSENPGEKAMMKLPEQFRETFAKEQALSEDIGRRLATWAKGGATETTSKNDTKVDLAALRTQGEEAATGGTDVLQTWWKGLASAEQQALKDNKEGFKAIAKKADEEAATRTNELETA